MSTRPVLPPWRVFAELLARSGQAVLRGVPPDGRGYWQARFWDRDAAESHPVLANSFLQQKATISDYLCRYGDQSRRILELACGTGEFTFLVATLTPAKQIVAIDISARALEIARSRIHHHGLTLIHGDFWTDHHVSPADLVLCVDAIHHLGDIEQVLERLRSFVAPGGTLIGNVWTADRYHEFQRKRYGSIRHLGRTALFFSTAVLIRLSGGRLRTGSYRTQLQAGRDVEQILRRVFGEVLDVRFDRYFVSFVCRP